MAEAIVCGAGTAGLASAAALRAAGAEVAVLERTDRVGASWRTRYDDLRLNTPGWMSTQPGYRASRRRYGEYPAAAAGSARSRRALWVGDIVVSERARRDGTCWKLA